MNVVHSTRDFRRREFVALGIGAFIVAGLPLAWRRQRLVRRTLPVMGTIAELAVLDDDERHAHAAIDDAMDVLGDVERTMSRFLVASDIGRANRSAVGEAVPIGPDTADVIAAALRWADASAGRFDPAIGRIVELWDVSHRHEPPPAPRVRRLAGRGLWRRVELGTHHGAPVVRFHDADVALDLGAIAKGFGVDRAVAALRERGVRDALVNVGGDLYALGRALDGEPWHIGIRDPDQPDRLAGTLDLADRAVATSGDYEQFFRWRGVRYHHLLDPATAAPRRTPVHSVSVIADDCMNADAGATAVFGMAAPEADRLLSRMSPGARVIRLT